MLNMDLVRGKPALKVEYQISLAADLPTTLHLVTNAPQVEGFDQWIYATHAALPPTLKSDMEAVLLLTKKSSTLSKWIYRLPPQSPAHRDFGALIAWLNNFGEGDFQEIIENTLKHLAEYCLEQGYEISPPYSENADKLIPCLSEHWSKEQLERAFYMIHTPLELKAQYISMLTRFWEQFYRQEFERCLPLMERSVEYHRHQDYRGDLPTVFTAITGRLVPGQRPEDETIERLVCIPSCHIGPYVILDPLPDLDGVGILHYNCRPTGTPEQKQTPAVQDLFPPLKALADETRLQILSILDGQELYAQEIVEHLDISQSAVSRHLRLMVTGELLKVRKEDSMKYYSINEDTLDTLARRLRSFREA